MWDAWFNVFLDKHPYVRIARRVFVVGHENMKTPSESLQLFPGPVYQRDTRDGFGHNEACQTRLTPGESARARTGPASPPPSCDFGIAFRFTSELLCVPRLVDYLLLCRPEPTKHKQECTMHSFLMLRKYVALLLVIACAVLSGPAAGAAGAGAG